jgi:hypothetical protein
MSMTSGSAAARAAAACCGAGGLLVLAGGGSGSSGRMLGAATAAAAAGRPLPPNAMLGEACLLGEESASESLSARNGLLPAAGRPRLLQGTGSICSSCSRSRRSLESMLEAGEPLAAAAASLGNAAAPQLSWRPPLLAPDILGKAPIAANAKRALIGLTTKHNERPAGATVSMSSWCLFSAVSAAHGLMCKVSQ